jgi:L,D-transpeptidase catalytic domain
MSLDTLRPPPRRRGAVLLGVLCALGAGLALLATESMGLASRPASWSEPTDLDQALAAAVVPATAMRLAEDHPAPQLPDPAEATEGAPEARLITIYRFVAQARLADALAASDALVRSHPHFRLAQLVHADLLAAHAAPLAGFGAGVTADGLAPLRDEALQRLAALREQPPAGAVPAEFVSLPASLPYAIAVDAARSRLYLFRNSERGLRLVDDFYITVGKQGVDKVSEGDQRTPLGLYFITGQIDPRALEDRFGAGALPLNYPNAYDRSRGRTGSGILLHGVPSATYARPPQDSDGCVVMANDDLLRLAARLPTRDTPVLISRRIEWQAPGGDQTAAHPTFLRAFAAWRSARLAADDKSLATFYPRQAQIDPARQLSAANAPKAIADTSIVAWRDDRELMIVTFRERAAGRRERDHVVRQYWGREGGDWRIMAEGQVY